MEYKIYVGTIVKINRGFMKGTFQIMYCGMSNDNTFVLSPFVTKGYQGFSPNIYYDSESTKIQVFDIGFDVLEVNEEYIILAD